MSKSAQMTFRQIHAHISWRSNASVPQAHKASLCVQRFGAPQYCFVAALTTSLSPVSNYSFADPRPFPIIQHDKARLCAALVMWRGKGGSSTVLSPRRFKRRPCSTSDTPRTHKAHFPEALAADHNDAGSSSKLSDYLGEHYREARHRRLRFGVPTRGRTRKNEVLLATSKCDAINASTLGSSA